MKKLLLIFGLLSFNIPLFSMESDVYQNLNLKQYFLNNKTPYALSYELLGTSIIQRPKQVEPMKTASIELPESDAEYRLKVSGKIDVEYAYSLKEQTPVINITREPIKIQINDRPIRIKTTSEQQLIAHTSAQREGAGAASARSSIPRQEVNSYQNFDFTSFQVTNKTPFNLEAQIQSSKGNILALPKELKPGSSTEFFLSQDQMENNPQILIKGTILFEAETKILLTGETINIIMIEPFQIKINAEPEISSASAISNEVQQEHTFEANTASAAKPQVEELSWKERARALSAAAARRTKAAAKAADKRARSAAQAASQVTERSDALENAAAIAGAAANKAKGAAGSVKERWHRSSLRASTIRRGSMQESKHNSELHEASPKDE
jgi:hypothetical protein